MNTKRSQFIARILLTLIEDPLHLKIYINKSSNKPNNFIFLFIIRNYRGKKEYVETSRTTWTLS